MPLATTTSLISKAITLSLDPLRNLYNLIDAAKGRSVCAVEHCRPDILVQPHASLVDAPHGITDSGDSERRSWHHVAKSLHIANGICTKFGPFEGIARTAILQAR